MNFKKATDALLKSVTLEDLAKKMGVSTQALRQARAAEGTSAHRPPPRGWEKAAAALAERQVKRWSRLAQELRISATADKG